MFPPSITLSYLMVKYILYVFTKQLLASRKLAPHRSICCFGLQRTSPLSLVYGSVIYVKGSWGGHVWGPWWINPAPLSFPPLITCPPGCLQGPDGEVENNTCMTAAPFGSWRNSEDQQYPGEEEICSPTGLILASAWNLLGTQLTW